MYLFPLEPIIRCNAKTTHSKETSRFCGEIIPKKILTPITLLVKIILMTHNIRELNDSMNFNKERKCLSSLSPKPDVVLIQ